MTPSGDDAGPSGSGATLWGNDARPSGDNTAFRRGGKVKWTSGPAQWNGSLKGKANSVQASVITEVAGFHWRRSEGLKVPNLADGKRGKGP